MTTPVKLLPRALGLDRVSAVFRQQAADFMVDELLGFEPTGEGEHLWLRIEKTGLNTVDVTTALAGLTGTREKDVGYAGLKDRVAVTTQWFSLVGAADIEADTVLPAGLRILEQVRNNRKLRRGSHKGNRFVITLRNVTAEDTHLAAWQTVIGQRGVPNFFGPQRFGHDGRNLEKAIALFAGSLKRVSRYQRGIYLSAARSCLFNEVLAERVKAGNWDSLLAGDVMALAGSGSVFCAETEDDKIPGRLAQGDIHPTGPMWGKGEATVTSDTLALETGVADRLPQFTQGMIKAGLKQERRPLRIMPEGLDLRPAGNGELVIEFSLPRGAYATSVLREMVDAPGL